tara:strand:- start:578712 stop:580499 length:1788 start_codon:yes stop_codon:yes gene_type:complete
VIKLHADVMALLNWTKRYPRVRALLCGMLSAMFLILSFPFFEGNGVWWLAVLIPLPLMLVADEPVIRPSRAAFFAALGTLPAWLWTHQWMWGVSKVGMPILMVYLMVYPGLFVWVGHRLVQRFERRWIVLPVAWIGIEYLRGTVAFTGYPWYLTAQPLIDSPGQILAGPAAFGGEYFVGFLSAVLAWQLWEMVRGGAFVGGAFRVVGLLGIWIAIGMAGLSGSSDGREVVVGIVQPNVPQDVRMEWTDRQRVADWFMLRGLTEASAIDPLRPDLIVWPEGFVPGWTFDPISLEHERDEGLTWSMRPRFEGDAPDLVGLPRRIPATTIVDQLLQMQESIGIPMVVGAVAYDNLKIERDREDWVLYTNDGMYNSAFVVDGGVVGPVWYNKMHLTPFGEVMPVISNWEWLEQSLLALGAEGMEFILSPGDSPVVLEVPDGDDVIRVGTPICFEATVSGVCRSLVFVKGNRRADLLVNMTNDGWFGSWEPSRRSHMLIARWRCVELATPMVRSANTGVSCVIDSRGRVVQEHLTKVNPNDPQSGYLNAQFRLGSGGERGGLAGSVLSRGFGWIMLGMTGLGFFLSFLQKRSEPVLETDE